MKLDTTEAAWKELQKYKISEDTYDFTNAPMEDIIYAYGVLNDYDEIKVINEVNN